MGKYSAEEIRAFKLKDILNCRMSALKASATNNEGKGKKAEVLKKEADVYYGWLRQDQDTVPEPSKKPDEYDKAREIEQQVTQNKQLPEPTLQQKKVLDAICEKAPNHAKHVIHGAVLKWAEAVHGQRSYPTKLESVETFLKWFDN